MTDFIRRLVDRGLGALHAGTPVAKPAQSGVHHDATLDKNLARPRALQMPDKTESRETDQRMHGPAVAFPGSPRPSPAPALAAPVADVSPPALRSRQPAITPRADDAELKSTGKQSPVVTANHVPPHNLTSGPPADIGGRADAPVPAVAFSRALAPPPATHPEAPPADPSPRTSRDRAASLAPSLPGKKPPLPDAAEAAESNRRGSVILRDASTDQRLDRGQPVNILGEQATPSPWPTGSWRESGDAAHLRPAPTTSRPAVALEAPRSRANTAKDSPLQPLSPRARRPADLAPIVGGGRVPAPERSVSVRIGTIEVRTEAPPPVAPPTPPMAPSAPGFDEYAALRSYGRRPAR
jgi:hypothetical protein